MRIKAEEIGKAIDIANESFERYPPPGYTKQHVEHVVSVHLDYKKMALHPDPKFRKMQSLRHIENDILTYFQEGSGEAVEYFWKQINLQKLGFKRKNMMSKILKRGKLKNRMEFDFVTDVIVPYQQEGLITEMEVHALNKMLSNFENNE